MQRRARSFSRIWSIYDLVVFSAAPELGKIPNSRDRDLARSRRRAGHRIAIASLADEEWICGALGCAANFLSAAKRLHVAMAVAVHPSPSLAFARARPNRCDVC